MPTNIKCDNCGNIIEITDAITRDLQSKILAETEKKHQAELKKLQQKQQEFEEKKKNELEKLKAEISEQSRKEAIDKVRREYDMKISTTKQEAEEREKQNTELKNEVLNLMKQLRKSQEIESNLKLEYEKQLFEEQEKIKLGAKKEAQDELNLKIAQKDKQLSDLQKQLQEAQRKAEQGSQQLQGEIQELILEEELKKAFVYDQITEVRKGQTGADIIQIVRSNFVNEVGKIVWESKNTKAWSIQWILKIKEDSRRLKADVAVIVSNILPENIKSFGSIDGVWICDLNSAIPLSMILREKLISINNIKEINNDRSSKAEVVYNYLTSNEFKQRLEVLVEYFSARNLEIEAEERYFIKKWEKEKKNIFRIMQNTAGMYGDLEGLIGNAMPKLKSLELQK